MLSEVLDLSTYPIASDSFKAKSKATLVKDGALVLPNFLQAAAIQKIHKEGVDSQKKAYFKTQFHNVYLTLSNPQYLENHACNRQVVSSKGCITDDQISTNSALRVLYNSEEFKAFLCYVLGEDKLFPYADPLSSINLHYAKNGQELGWHFDNSSFAITLMIQPPESGGQFEYVSNVRDADNGEMSFEMVDSILDGEIVPKELSMAAGSLVLFRGRNAIHRVAPNTGDVTRMLVVLAYNSQPGVSLSESARMTFYGRLD